MGTTGKGSMRLESVSRGRVAYLRLYGTVDETFRPQELLDAASGRDVILNLKAVTRFSSFGVRDWVHVMEALRTKVERILFVECSPAVVAQLNMVENFSGGATVVSIQLPYFCEACSWDTEVTFTLPSTPALVQSLPQINCKRCHKNMTFDDDQEGYFSFAQSLRKGPLDPAMAAFIRDFAKAMDGADAASAEPHPQGSLGARRNTESFVIKIPPVGRLVAERAALAWRWLLARPRVLWSGAAVLGAALVVAVTLALTPSGIPPQQVALFHEHMQAKRFGEAQELLASLKKAGQLNAALHKQFAEQIATGRKEALAVYQQQIPQLLGSGRYGDVIAVGKRVAVLGPLDHDCTYAVAEAHRNLNQLAEAEPYYARFADLIVEKNPDDARLDDALFWRGESMTAAGNLKEARKLYRVVAYEMPESNYRRAALVRLRTLVNK